jgi:hypothetical protein
VLILLAAALTAGPAPTARAQAGSRGFLSNLGVLENLTRQASCDLVDSLHLAPNCPVTILSTTWHEGNWFVGNLLGEALAARGHKVQVIEVATAPEGAKEENGSTETGQPEKPAHNGRPKGTGGAGAGNTEGAGAGAGAAPGDTTAVSPDSSATGEPSDPLLPNDQTPAQPAESESTTVSSAAAKPVVIKAEATPRVLPAGEVLDVRVLEFGVGYSNVNRVWLFGPVRFTRVGGVYFQVCHLKGPEGELRSVASAARHQVDRLSGSQRALAEGASYPFARPDLKTPSLSRYIEPTVVVAIVASLVYLFNKNQN